MPAAGQTAASGDLVIFLSRGGKRGASHIFMPAAGQTAASGDLAIFLSRAESGALSIYMPAAGQTAASGDLVIFLSRGGKRGASHIFMPAAGQTAASGDLAIFLSRAESGALSIYMPAAGQTAASGDLVIFLYRGGKRGAYQLYPPPGRQRPLVIWLSSFLVAESGAPINYIRPPAGQRAPKVAPNPSAPSIPAAWVEAVLLSDLSRRAPGRGERNLS
ncbi:hypothetical protein FN846DRAFT_1635 [Sphaerosporella brunnea]|uniref:Uncharacterized protein n=1 Tax=Sphaerosporella brunnea TaxID=1250544 RepID=A0A5J5FCP3_9PEZI|nr:hypothetical protein FN846DRAFT_1635 [Sphaerosporella brunnea]